MAGLLARSHGTVGMKRFGGVCALASLLVIARLGAAGSDVADAVMRGDKSAVRALLERNADVNARQADGATALQWAVYRGDLDTAELLIHAGADVNAANRDGATALSLACTGGNAALIDALLKAGADPNERLPQAETALMMASRTGRVEAMKVLLDQGADVNAKEALRGTTALMWAASQGYPAAVQLLIERGAEVSARSNPAPRGKAPYVTPSKRRPAPGTPPAAEPQRATQGVTQQRATPELDLVGGGLTALVYAVRQNDLDSIAILLAAGAEVNQVTSYGWSPLLVATLNRNYKVGSFLLERGADPNLANNGLWTPLYLAVDNRNAEGGDYPVRKPDIDHLVFIKMLLAHGANPNARIRDNTWTRTVFTQQWLDEDGATAFLRAAQSSDLPVMRLLLAYGADPKIRTEYNVTALQVASGVAWVEGNTYEWSQNANVETVKLLLDLGLDPNFQNDGGLTALHGAAHKGRNAIVQMLVDHGAKLDLRDYGVTWDPGYQLRNHTWLPVDYADGFIKIGTQSPIPQPQTGLLLRQLMKDRGISAPPVGRTIDSVCKFEICEPLDEKAGTKQ